MTSNLIVLLSVLFLCRLLGLWKNLKLSSSNLNWLRTLRISLPNSVTCTWFGGVFP